MEALTRWPPGSTTERSVCRNAARAPASASVACPLRDLLDVGAGAQAEAAEQRRRQPAGVEHARGREQRQHELGARQRRGAQQQAHLAAEPAAVDQHEPLAPLGELVGELHRDAAAERVPDEGRAVVAERDEQVAHGARVRAERVVAARLGRAAVAEQVRARSR